MCIEETNHAFYIGYSFPECCISVDRNRDYLNSLCFIEKLLPYYEKIFVLDPPYECFPLQINFLQLEKSISKKTIFFTRYNENKFTVLFKNSENGMPPTFRFLNMSTSYTHTIFMYLIVRRVYLSFSNPENEGCVNAILIV